MVNKANIMVCMAYQIVVSAFEALTSLFVGEKVVINVYSD